MKTMYSAAIVLALAGSPFAALASPTTIIDNTAGTAVNDGIVAFGEYVGSSVGINAGFGNVIGSSSSIGVDSSGTGLNFGLNRGPGGFNDAIVIYIDSIGGGFASTATLNDHGDALRQAISGSTGGATSLVTFASGFLADYAIALDNGFAGVWKLASGDNNSLNFVTSANLNAPGGAGATNIEMNLTLADIGITAGASFTYVATYLNDGNVFRSDEFHGVAQSTANTGNIGANPIALAQGDFNTFQTIPEPASMALFTLGVLGMAWRFARKKA